MKSNKEKSAGQEYERCVCCWKQLDILKSTPIYHRKHYVQGCGQLCEDCYEEIMNCKKNFADLLIE